MHYNHERGMIRRNIIAMVVLSLILAAYVIAVPVCLNDQTFYVYVSRAAADGIDKISVEIEPDDVVVFSSVEETAQGYRIGLHPVGSGNAYAAISVLSAGGTGEEAVTDYLYLEVGKNGIIRDRLTRNYTGCQTAAAAVAFFLILLSGCLWGGFAAARKRYHFSYQTMFYSGIGLWFTMVAVIQSIYAVRMVLKPTVYDMRTFYNALCGSGKSFMLHTMPFVTLFALFMLISNLELMRKESRRPQNALGIAIGALMIGGELLMLRIESMEALGSALDSRIYSALSHLGYGVYAMFECLLLGAILCGLMAAFHTPKYEQDYVMILGCSIRKDGTLYPLIRGRVDRAIAFYRKQFELTGKAPVLIPSGGQGKNEVIPEAEAMSRYLLMQGIPSEHIMKEDKSRNTLENMLFSKQLIEEREGKNAGEVKVSFSTTNYHVFRSGILSHKAEFEPDGMGAPTNWYFWPNAFMRELGGLFAYRKRTISALLIILSMLTVLAEIFLR